MRIIPVIDLKDGVVVRGVAGQRELYRPVESVLGCDATAKGVAEAFSSHFGFQSVYVADLDAIAGTEPDWDANRAIASAGLGLLVDAGTNSIERASRFRNGSPQGGWYSGVVIGLESLRDERDLSLLSAAIGPDRAVFSLDLKNGKPLTGLPAWCESEPIELVDAAVETGIKRLIVLDLASVGIAQGVWTSSLCSSIRARHPRLEITSGGGVRNRADLEQLARAGCDQALVASALHDGRLSREDVARFC